MPHTAGCEFIPFYTTFRAIRLLCKILRVHLSFCYIILLLHCCCCCHTDMIKLPSLHIYIGWTCIFCCPELEPMDKMCNAVFLRNIEKLTLVSTSVNTKKIAMVNRCFKTSLNRSWLAFRTIDILTWAQHEILLSSPFLFCIWYLREKFIF